MIFDKITFGLDLYCNMIGKQKYKYVNISYLEKYITSDSYNKYDFNIDTNYALNNNMYLGAYLDMSKSTLNTEAIKRP